MTIDRFDLGEQVTFRHSLNKKNLYNCYLNNKGAVKSIGDLKKF
jgi:hypothetical protein